jgi:hypothetical protein
MLRPFDPVGEIFQPIVTGPDRIPIFQRGAGIMTEKKLWRNRKERKAWGRRLQSEDPGLEVVHSHAAGIDVGNGMHYVAVRRIAIHNIDHTHSTTAEFFDDAVMRDSLTNERVSAGHVPQI